jgi:hypothetical protein
MKYHRFNHKGRYDMFALHTYFKSRNVWLIQRGQNY